MSKRTQPTVLVWKRGLPTQEGWYWRRFDNTFRSEILKEVEIVRVRLYVKDLAIGNSTIKGWPQMEKSEWAGPIPQPMEGE